MQMQGGTEGDALNICPSFNAYASGGLADTASKVIGESGSCGDEDDEEFEFSMVSDADGNAFTVSPGQIRQVFPVFNRDLLSTDSPVPSFRIPIKSLPFEAEEGDAGVPAVTRGGAESYCLWAPRVAAGLCKKCKSTGSSSCKRWRIIDLLRRCNSTDGKDSFVFLTPISLLKHKKTETSGGGAAAAAEKLKPQPSRRSSSSSDGGEDRERAVAGKGNFSSAHQTFYAGKSRGREGEKRRSYLPYRQNLVGFFAKVHGFGRSHPPSPPL